MPKTLDTVSSSLPPGASETFLKEGYYVARGLFTHAEMDEVREAFMQLNADGPVEGLSEIRPEHGKYTSDDPLSFYPRMMMPHLRLDLDVGPLAARYMLEPRLHAFLKASLGAEPVGVQTMFYFKPPKARGQELHQDNYYLRVKPGTCMAAWIAVDDADFENGGMMVVPGTQDMEIVCPEHSNPDTSFTIDYVAPPKGTGPVHVDLKAGDVLFFNGSLIHGSSPNISPTRFRRSLICHYIPLNSVVGGSYLRNPMTFDGKIVNVEESEDGGPCGTAQPMRPH